MPLDKLTFDGGLNLREEAGGGKYTIKHYQDLQDILGRGGIIEDSMSMEIFALSYSDQYIPETTHCWLSAIKGG